MERFGNFFCGLKTSAFSLQPLAFASLLRTGGSLFCGLKTLAFPARHSLGDGGSLQHSAFDCAFAVLAFSLQPLAFVPRVSDQLCNAVNQLQTLLYAA
jgi:hypothetical protein